MHALEFPSSHASLARSRKSEPQGRWHRDQQGIQASVRGIADRASLLLLAVALKHLNRSAIGTHDLSGSDRDVM